MGSHCSGNKLQDVAGAVTEHVTPAGNLTDSGSISFADVDLTDVHLVSATGTIFQGEEFTRVQVVDLTQSSILTGRTWLSVH